MRKLTYEFIKEQFESEDYTLLSTEYKNNYTKLEYICPKGHEGSIIWNNWHQGQRCAECVGNKKLTIEFVKESFKREGYTLVSTEYVNNNQKLVYICSKGHRSSIRWGDWQQNQRCKQCGFKKISEANSNPSKETRKKMSESKTGENHPMWKGGISCGQYCQAWKDKEFKQDVLDRDDNIAWDIGFWYNGGLSIHHIDFDKKNCHPSNLITVSRGMNAAANFDREWHTEWFQTAMINRLGYKYN